MGAKNRYAVCVCNEGYEASLELHKVYQVIPDDSGAAHDLVRVIDESGEDYLFPDACFVPVEVSESAEDALRRT